MSKKPAVPSKSKPEPITPAPTLEKETPPEQLTIVAAGDAAPLGGPFQDPELATVYAELDATQQAAIDGRQLDPEATVFDPSELSEQLVGIWDSELELWCTKGDGEVYYFTDLRLARAQLHAINAKLRQADRAVIRRME